MTRKICSKCKQEKDLEIDYYIQYKATSTRKTYYYSQCKECSSRDGKKRYTPLRDYKIKLKRRYNLSWEEYINLYNNQKGTCRICNKFLELPGNSNENKRLCGFVDHNHITRKVRGILCAGCNTGLGHFEDSQNKLRSAIQYLDETN